MTKSKIILAITTLICAIGATTAQAQFSSTTSTGAIATFPALSSLSQGKAIIECKSSTTTKAAGTWTIQTSEETIVTKGTKEQKQPATTKGPHEALLIEKWGACTALGLAAEVSACRLQLAQPGGSTGTITGSVQTDCTVNVGKGTCIITVEQSAANHNLTGITAANSGTGVSIKANVPELTEKAAPPAACEAGGLVKETKGAKFSTGITGSEAIVTAEQKLV